MTYDLPFVSLLIFLPLIGCLFILMIHGQGEAQAANARGVALLASLATLVVAVVVALQVDFNNPEFQLQEKVSWIASFNIFYHVGIDGISMLFILLTTILMPIALLSSWQAIQFRVKEYMIVFLVLETMLLGMFCSLDFIVFYFFFEGVLIPMFLIIGIWGGERRVYAAYKFFLFTLLGSVLMLVAILAIYLKVGSMGIPEAMQYCFDSDLQKWLWLAFFASFAVKLPMWPVHTWLPDAHVEAPTAGSVILAGILLKMGGYGFVRFSLPMFPEASQYFANFVYVLSITAIIYTSLVALVQKDMKKLVAYSSVAHMGFVTFGVFSFSEIGLQGALFQMFSHGLVSAALFLCVGVLYDRKHSRLIEDYGGVVNRMPIFAVGYMIFSLAALALPGTSGFIGEIFVILAVFQIEWWWAACAATGMILTVTYMLWLYRRVMLGPLEKESLQTLKDLSIRECLVFAPLVVLTLALGIYPMPALNLTSSSVKKIVTVYQPPEEGDKPEQGEISG
ncbi:MAG: NADH-quinone oxidoreductase subunit M [Pseudomonadota bacterium]